MLIPSCLCIKAAIIVFIFLLFYLSKNKETNLFKHIQLFNKLALNSNLKIS